MKVFIFNFHTAIDGEFVVSDSFVYSTFKAAIAAFEEWREEEKKYAEENWWEVNDNQLGHFEASLGGDYCNNHTEGTVVEKDLL